MLKVSQNRFDLLKKHYEKKVEQAREKATRHESEMYVEMKLAKNSTGWAEKVHRDNAKWHEQEMKDADFELGMLETFLEDLYYTESEV